MAVLTTSQVAIVPARGFKAATRCNMSQVCPFFPICSTPSRPVVAVLWCGTRRRWLSPVPAVAIEDANSVTEDASSATEDASSDTEDANSAIEEEEPAPKLTDREAEEAEKHLHVGFLPTNESSETLLRMRHTCALVMAMAVKKIIPEAKPAAGSWTEDGFYYDFNMAPPLEVERLQGKITLEMKRICKRDLPLIREEVSREEAKRRVMELNDPNKLDILEGIKGETVTIYHIGDEWWDLSPGPHLQSTAKIIKRTLELEGFAEAHLRGDATRPKLQRINGTSWETTANLKAYKKHKTVANRSDHRRLGKQLDLFSIQDDVGGGLVSWHTNGLIAREVVADTWTKLHRERGYQIVSTPHLAKADLWNTSGHLDFYRDNMFDQMLIEDESYYLRPMNCPHHIMLYKKKLYSYDQLPVRFAELGTVYRNEQLIGNLHGLFRLRAFTQDEAHIFCSEDQVKDEIRGVLDLTEEMLQQFDFRRFEVILSTRPDKSVGDDDMWQKTTSALKDALADKGWRYKIHEGGGAFYGPKIDIKLKDCFGRKWQCSTVQLDYSLPETFDLVYVDSNQERKRPVMIHRAILGSLERFFGLLTEHHSGNLPIWIAPVQVRVLPETEKEVDYGNQLLAKLMSAGIRAEICHGEELPQLISNAEAKKVPLMAVLGPKQMETGKVSVRSTCAGELGNMPVEAFIRQIQVALKHKLRLWTS